MQTSDIQYRHSADRYTPEEQAHAVAGLRSWFRLQTWTAREGLLLLTGIDPQRSDCLVLTDRLAETATQPEWARITASPGTRIDDAGVPHATGYVLDPDQLFLLSELLRLWASNPAHTMNDRHAPAYYVEWAAALGCAPFWHQLATEAGLLPDKARDKEPVVEAPASEPRPAATRPKFTMTKAALIAQHIHEWPTIARNIADAKRNGLSAAAKDGKRGWREDDAMEWARNNRQLPSTQTPVNSLAGAVHKMSSLPASRHTLER